MMRFLEQNYKKLLKIKTLFVFLALTVTLAVSGWAQGSTVQVLKQEIAVLKAQFDAEIPEAVGGSTAKTRKEAVKKMKKFKEEIKEKLDQIEKIENPPKEKKAAAK